MSVLRALLLVFSASGCLPATVGVRQSLVGLCSISCVDKHASTVHRVVPCFVLPAANCSLRE
jgi:hypothetical protein